ATHAREGASVRASSRPLAAAAATALALTGCPASAPPAPYASTIAEMTRRIEAQMAAAQVTGLSIALVDGDQVVWARGFGWADREAGRLADADTVFEIGSVSKTFGAATVLQLVEEGRMDLDDPLALHVPAFTIRQGDFASGPVTLRSVLTHHSGIPSDLFNGAFTEGEPFDYDAWLLSWLAHETTSAPVGAVLAYSNSAFALLRPAIAHAAPEGFDARAAALFDSMGMRSTSYALDARIPRDRLSRSYDEGVPQPHRYGNLSTAGSVLSSASDMARYVRMMIGRGEIDGVRVLAPASVDEMARRQNAGAPFDLDRSIGLSWFLELPGHYAGRVVEHEGATPTFHAMVRILLDHRLGVVVLSNTMSADVNGIARETLELALEEKTGLAPPPALVPVRSEPDPSWTQEQLAALEGVYVADAPGLTLKTVAVTAVEGGIRLSDRAGTWIPRKNGCFSLPDGEPDPQRLQFRFEELDGRRVVTVLTGGHRYLWAARMEEGPPDAVAAWEGRAGSWTVTNLVPGTTWPGVDTIAIARGDDGILRVQGTLRGDVPITPVDADEALVAGIGRNRGERLRAVVVDGVEQVELWGYRYRR
ncbi:MAG TPA: serine hydrolase domain-containing protein, partial [Anaeromyxobacteraceae bacterium]|nr:serine hydrolase domain-containing protein [Anaeromyxobacteraceae bacterium]